MDGGWEWAVDHLQYYIVIGSDPHVIHDTVLCNTVKDPGPME
jgi:hypothetical protein